MSNFLDLQTYPQTECFQQAFHMKAKPSMEEASQKLMLLYAKFGMRNASLKTNDKYKRTLKAEFDAEPNEATISIYRKIAEEAEEAFYWKRTAGIFVSKKRTFEAPSSPASDGTTR